jgi:hypothetical protein
LEEFLQEQSKLFLNNLTETAAAAVAAHSASVAAAGAGGAEDIAAPTPLVLNLLYLEPPPANLLTLSKDLTRELIRYAPTDYAKFCVE